MQNINFEFMTVRAVCY